MLIVQMIVKVNRYLLELLHLTTLTSYRAALPFEQRDLATNSSCENISTMSDDLLSIGATDTTLRTSYVKIVNIGTEIRDKNVVKSYILDLNKWISPAAFDVKSVYVYEIYEQKYTNVKWHVLDSSIAEYVQIKINQMRWHKRKFPSSYFVQIIWRMLSNMNLNSVDGIVFTDIVSAHAMKKRLHVSLHGDFDILMKNLILSSELKFRTIVTMSLDESLQNNSRNQWNL